MITIPQEITPPEWSMAQERKEEAEWEAVYKSPKSISSSFWCSTFCRFASPAAGSSPVSSSNPSSISSSFFADVGSGNISGRDGGGRKKPLGGYGRKEGDGTYGEGEADVRVY